MNDIRRKRRQLGNVFCGEWIPRAVAAQKRRGVKALIRDDFVRINIVIGIRIARRADGDLCAVVLAEAEKLGPLAEERGLTVTLAPGEPCIVTADEGRIAQAVENLLTNALRYSPAGSRIKLRVDKEEKRALFRAENPVEQLFTTEELEKVWEPFWRRDKARSGGWALPS